MKMLDGESKGGVMWWDKDLGDKGWFNVERVEKELITNCSAPW